MNLVMTCFTLLALQTGPEPVVATPADQPALVLGTRFRHRATDEIEGNAAIGWNQVLTAAAWDADLQSRVDQLLAAPWEGFDATGAAGELRASYDTLAQFVEMASRRDSCDWQSPIRQQGFDVLMPELGRYRTLSKLLRLRARNAMHNNDFAGAVGAVRDGLELARDLSGAKTAVQALVGVAIGRAMVDEVEIIASRPGAPSMYWALADLPRPFFAASTFNVYEEAMLDFTVPSLRELEAMDADDPRAVTQAVQVTRDLARQMESTPTGSGDFALAARAIATYPAARSWMITTGVSEERVRALPVSYVVVRYDLAEFRRACDEAFRWTSLSYPEAEPALLAMVAEREKNPSRGDSLASVLPAIERVFASVWGFERRIALLRVVEALRLHSGASGALPATLGEITAVPVPRDPITGEPFGYRVEGDVAVITGPAVRLANEPRELEHRVRISR